MYKLVAIDLDGTLLNSYGQISEKNKKNMQRCIEKGVEIVLCSGRNPMSVSSIASEIGIKNHIICGNGSLIYHLKNREIIYNKFLEKRKVQQIIDICEENSIYYSVNTTKNIIAKALNYNVLFYHQENAKKSEDKKTNINIVQNIYKYVEEREEEDYLKINICDAHNVIFNGIIRKLRTIKNIDVLDVAHMSRKVIKVGTENVNVEYYYTEITQQGINKWEALKYLSNILNINENEIMTIGDNINDKEMLQNAGLGIAMGNSAPYIKDFAKAVVNDNDLDGVSEALEKYILSE